MFAICGEDERDESDGGEESPGRVRRSITKNLPVRLLEERDRDLYDVYKQGIVGGPSIIFCRYQECGQTRINVPRYGDTAKECGLILGVDANALYLWSMMQDMPVGEGVTVRRVEELGSTTLERGSLSGSKVALGWLEWMRRQTGEDIRHAHHGKEVRVGEHGLPVDGYCAVKKKIYQFHGCFYHGHPCEKTRGMEYHPFRE